MPTLDQTEGLWILRTCADYFELPFGKIEKCVKNVTKERPSRTDS